MAKTRIADFYAGQKILLTGGSGFMGKVFIEKVLRACPDVDTIYVIIREKRGKSIQERWKAICELPLFDKVKVMRPESLGKVKLVAGDLSKENLGISVEDQQELIENVTLAFHIAADVQFSESINAALVNNVKATKIFCDFIKSMKHLQVFEYVSTAFSNFNLPSESAIEKVLPACQDWRVLLKLQETQPQVLQPLKDKLLCGHPNPYTWSKSLAEQIVKEYSDFYPTVIIRPAVVEGCFREDPLVGWCDSMSGIVSLVLAILWGVLRVLPISDSVYSDIIPVDLVTSAEIIAAKKAAESKKQIEVYNCGLSKYSKMYVSKLIENKEYFMNTYQLEKAWWATSVTTCNNKHLFYIVFLQKQVLPALLIDFILKLLGKEKRLVKLCIKACNILQTYINFMKSVQFPSDNFESLGEELHEADKTTFSVDIRNISSFETIVKSGKGCLKYYFKCDMSEEAMERSKKHVKRLKIISRVVDIVYYLFIGVLLTKFLIYITCT